MYVRHEEVTVVIKRNQHSEDHKTIKQLLRIWGAKAKGQLFHLKVYRRFALKMLSRFGYKTLWSLIARSIARRL